MQPIDGEDDLESLPQTEKQKIDQSIKSFQRNIKFCPTPGPQSEAYFSKADILLFGGKPGGGKDLDIYTLIPVSLSTDSSGYKRHGELVPGDKVFSPSGELVSVIYRHPNIINGHVYEVEFDTGEIIVAGEGHLWSVLDRKNRLRMLYSSNEWRENRKKNRPSRGKMELKNKGVSAAAKINNSLREHEIKLAENQILSTSQMAENYIYKDRLNYSIDIIKPIQCEDQKLPVEPYLLGLWLGDGTTKADNIIMLDDDWATIEKFIPIPYKIYNQKTNGKPISVRGFKELKNRIDRKQPKRIPSIYLRSSYNQRLELLRGMMDTDGTCGNNGQCELGFSNENLALDAQELINSLGIKSSIRRKSLAHLNAQDSFRMKFIPHVDVFKLPRKLARQKKQERLTVGRRYITSIREAKPCITNCITVEGNLYCVGRTFIPTHNSALGIGLALNEHERSLLIRKEFADLPILIDNAKGILGTSDGFVGGTRPKYTKPDGGIIHFQGVDYEEGVDTGKQGDPHDFIFVDEVAQLPENVVRMLIGWNRTNKKGQRCRMVMGSNPPLDSTGDWLCEFFAPWLDSTYHNPAKSGELRWFIINADGRSQEVKNGDDMVIDGITYYPHSRTFIPSDLKDNPYLDAKEYSRKLQLIPEPYRTMLLSGNFMIARKDLDHQVIPTQWIREAQARWKDRPPEGVPMCAIAVDPAGGGDDETVIARRHDCWFAPLIAIPGKDTPNGNDIAGKIISYRSSGATVIIDMGGGYGGVPYMQLKDNNIEAVSYKGVEKSAARTADRKFGFFNKRSEAYWKFREALDPAQQGGSPIALPDDPKLVSDLTAPTFEILTKGIKIENKEDVCKKLQRSPDRGDAVVMCWLEGQRLSTNYEQWKNKSYSLPRINTAHDNQRIYHISNHRR